MEQDFILILVWWFIKFNLFKSFHHCINELLCFRFCFRYLLFENWVFKRFSGHCNYNSVFINKLQQFHVIFKQFDFREGLYKLIKLLAEILKLVFKHFTDKLINFLCHSISNNLMVINLSRLISPPCLRVINEL